MLFYMLNLIAPWEAEASPRRFGAEGRTIGLRRCYAACMPWNVESANATVRDATLFGM